MAPTLPGIVEFESHQAVLCTHSIVKPLLDESSLLMLCYNKVRSNKRQGQKNCSGIARVWLTPNRCRHTVWLPHYRMDCIPTQTGKRWQLVAISVEAQAAPNYRPQPCLLKHTWTYAHVRKCTAGCAACGGTNTHKHTHKLIPFISVIRCLTSGPTVRLPPSWKLQSLCQIT